MKSRTWILTVLYLFSALAMSVCMAAQDNPSSWQAHNRPKYKLIDLGTFGGPQSSFTGNSPVLTSWGAAVGAADTSAPDPFYPNFNPLLGDDPFVQHGFVSFDRGQLHDLGSLPGGFSSFGIQIGQDGRIVGASQNGQIDPVTGWPSVHAVLWKRGQILDLGTLGGNESGATIVNSRGWVIGFAASTTPDPFSMLGFGTQTRAFLWRNGVIKDLGTLGGPDAIAWYLNERGQIAGQAYTSSIPNPVTGIPPMDPFIWEDGKMFDLGTLGGALGFANRLNNRGQVVGLSDLAGDENAHPFLWDRGTLTDLGTLGGSNGQAFWVSDAGDVVGVADLPGDQTHDAFLWRHGVMADLGNLGETSVAYAVNSKGQVVGASRIDSSTVHAFFWEDRGLMIDLNRFLPPGSGATLEFAEYIDEVGNIAVNGVLSNGDEHAFLLMPCDREGYDGCRSMSSSSEAAAEAHGLSTHNSGSLKLKSESPLSPMERFRSQMWQRYHPGQAAERRD